MSSDTAQAAVLKVLRRYSTYPREPVPDARLADDLGIDSLTLLTVVSEVEAALGIQFSAESFSERNMSTVEGFTNLVAELVRQRTPNLA